MNNDQIKKRTKKELLHTLWAITLLNDETNNEDHAMLMHDQDVSSYTTRPGSKFKSSTKEYNFGLQDGLELNLSPFAAVC